MLVGFMTAWSRILAREHIFMDVDTLEPGRRAPIRGDRQILVRMGSLKAQVAAQA